MTKEEFIKRVNDRLEELKTEYEKVSQEESFLTDIGASREDIIETSYECSLFYQELDALKNIIDYYAGARIKKASNFELDYKRKQEIEDLDMAISLTKVIINTCKDKIGDVKKERDSLAADYVSSPEGSDVRNEINRKVITFKDTIYSLERKIESEKDDLKDMEKKKEELSQMDDDKYREYLLSKLSSDELLAMLSADRDREHYSAYTRLLAAVADYPQDAVKMAHLIHRFDTLQSDKARANRVSTGRLYHFSQFIPVKYRKQIEDEIWGIYKNGLVIDPWSASEILVKCKVEVEKEAALISTEFAHERIFRLIDPEYMEDPASEIDIYFLRMHTDKLDSNEINELHKLLIQKSNLDGKIPRQKRFYQSQIDELEEIIKEKYLRLFNQVKEYYKKKESLTGYCGLDLVRAASSGRLQSRIKETIEQIDEAITDMHKRKGEILDKQREYDGYIAEVVKQMIELSDPELKIDAKDVHGESFAGGLQSIARSAATEEKVIYLDIADEVAQKEADKEEAELRGISYQDLLELKLRELRKMQEEMKASETKSKSDNTKSLS